MLDAPPITPSVSTRTVAVGIKAHFDLRRTFDAVVDAGHRQAASSDLFFFAGPEIPD